MLNTIYRSEFRVKILLGRNRRYALLRIIAIVFGYNDVPIKRHYFIAYFLLKANTCGNSHHHHHNANCNSCNTNFYYWCRNATFIRFTANNAFCYKILIIQILYMRFNVFKNTVLFPIAIGIVLLISCGNTTKTGDGRAKTKDPRPKTQDQKPITVGANRTDLYLPLLKGKRVGLVANPSSVVFKKDESYTHLVDSLLALNVKIAKVFSPEHGFRGTADAGELVNDSKDAKTGLAIISLHGEHRKPKQEDLSNIDV